jgi:hypothetical protein
MFPVGHKWSALILRQVSHSNTSWAHMQWVFRFGLKYGYNTSLSWFCCRLNGAHNLHQRPSYRRCRGKNKCTNILSNQKNLRRLAEGQMGRWITKGYMESQQIHLQRNKLHAFQAIVWGWASNTGRYKFQKHENKAGGRLQPHRSWVEWLNRVVENECRRELVGLSKWDEGLEGQKGKREDIDVEDLVLLWCSRTTLQKSGTKMGQTILDNRENEARFIPFGRHRWQNVVAFLECWQSLSFLHLA